MEALAGRRSLCKVARRPMGVRILENRRQVVDDLLLHIFPCQMPEPPWREAIRWKSEGEGVYGITSLSQNAIVTAHWNRLFRSRYVRPVGM